MFITTTDLSSKGDTPAAGSVCFMWSYAVYRIKKKDNEDSGCRTAGVIVSGMAGAAAVCRTGDYEHATPVRRDADYRQSACAEDDARGCSGENKAAADRNGEYSCSQ